MNLHVRFAVIALLSASATGIYALPPLRARCTIRPSENAQKLSLHIYDGECGQDHHRDCGTTSNDEPLNRFTGVSLADLSREGAQLTATLSAEAGTFTCTGTVHDGVLSGESLFLPEAAFVDRMGQMGFTGFDSEKLQAYAFVKVDSGYVRSLQQTKIGGITTDNLIALRIFNVDPTYINSITALGYEVPDADKLIGLRVQGVEANEVREIRMLGYRPSLDEMIQIRIFHITPDFIRRMQSRGLKDLTIAKLVQIRIFNLAD
jgi:hypothetical protein